MWLDPKYKRHTTHQSLESRSLHVICMWAVAWPGHPERSPSESRNLHHGSAGGEQRQGFPWLLHQMRELPRSRGCPCAWCLLLPLAAGVEKVQGRKHQSAQAQTAFGIAFQKADGLQFPFGVADLQADVGGFICVSWNGWMELGIWRDFWYFLLPVGLNILKDDLCLNILTLPLLILLWKTKQRDSWKHELKKKGCWSFFFPSLERECGH